MKRIIFLRHGETNKNRTHRLHAVEDKTRLNQVGRRQISMAATTLVTYSPCTIHSSTELRAVESARIVSDILKIPIIQDALLQERDWGIFTGRPWHEVEQLLEAMTLKERYTFVPSGGKSWEMFETRITKAVDQIVGAMMHDTTTLIITHGGVIRAILPSLLKLPKETSINYEIANGSLTVLHYTTRGYQPKLINNTDHLTFNA